MEQYSRERLQIALVVIIGCIFSALLQVGGQILLFRLWWSKGVDFPYPIEHTAGYTRLLNFGLFPAIAALMGFGSGFLVGRRTWAALLMLWSVFLSLAVAAVDLPATAIIGGIAYALIAVLAVRVGASIRRPPSGARMRSEMS